MQLFYWYCCLSSQNIQKEILHQWSIWSSWQKKYQSTHLHPGNYILNWQNSPLKEAGDTCFIWQICERIYEILLQSLNLQLQKLWQEHVEKRYPCIVNRTEWFSHILEIGIYCRSHYFLNLWKKAILSYKRHTTNIHIRHKQGIF